MLIALSLFLPYFLGLGCIILFTIPGLQKDSPLDGPGIARLLATLLLSGILLHYTLVLLLEKLGLSLAIGSVLSLAGLFRAYLVLRIQAVRPRAFSWVLAGSILYVTILFALYILFDPLSAWDARSIWFFHGKIIFYNQSLSQSAGWNDQSFGWSHVFYPKLVPVLAAQFAYAGGFWNEYLPKASLLALLVPALMAFLAFFRSFRISFLYVILMLFMGLGQWLWNGYVDGYFALYTGLTSLFFGRWLVSRDNGDLIAGVAFLGVAVNLKNEGLFFALTVSSCMLAVRFVRARTAPAEAGSLGPGFWVFTALTALGMVLWSWKKHLWGLSTHVPMELARVPLRLSEGAFGTIVDALILREGVATACIVFLVALGIVKAFRLPISPAVWVPLLTSLAYGLGICLIYLGTPYDLPWHLGTSASRTMLPVLQGIFCATFVLMQELERNDTPENVKIEPKTKPRRG